MLEPEATGFELEPCVAGGATNNLVITIAYTRTLTNRFGKEFGLGKTKY
jgi:hypothetical protein